MSKTDLDFANKQYLRQLKFKFYQEVPSRNFAHRTEEL